METIPPERSPSATLLHPAALAALLTAFALAGAALVQGDRSLILSVAMCVAVIAAFLAAPVTRSYLSRVALPARIILAAMIGLMLAGQFADQPRRTFPFSVFHMFGSVHRDAGRGSVTIYELQGVGRDGTRVSINPDRLFPTLGLGTMRMGTRLRSLIDAAAPATEGCSPARRHARGNRQRLAAARVRSLAPHRGRPQIRANPHQSARRGHLRGRLDS